MGKTHRFSIHGTPSTIILTPELKQKIEEYCKQYEISKSTLIRQVLNKFFMESNKT